jgi:hypothetical protein
MSAKILYTKKGSDPTTIVWPPTGPTSERWTFSDGAVTSVLQLIGYPDHIEFADGRTFPALSTQGSTLQHQKDK